MIEGGDGNVPVIDAKGSFKGFQQPTWFSQKFRQRTGARVLTRHFRARLDGRHRRQRDGTFHFLTLNRWFKSPLPDQSTNLPRKAAQTRRTGCCRPPLPQRPAAAGGLPAEVVGAGPQIGHGAACAYR